MSWWGGGVAYCCAGKPGGSVGTDVEASTALTKAADRPIDCRAGYPIENRGECEMDICTPINRTHLVFGNITSMSIVNIWILDITCGILIYHVT